MRATEEKADEEEQEEKVHPEAKQARRHQEEEKLPVSDYIDLAGLSPDLRRKVVCLRGSELGRKESGWGDVVLIGTGESPSPL